MSEVLIAVEEMEKILSEVTPLEDSITKGDLLVILEDIREVISNSSTDNKDTLTSSAMLVVNVFNHVHRMIAEQPSLGITILDPLMRIMEGLSVTNNEL